MLPSFAKGPLYWIVAAVLVFTFWSLSSRIQLNERELSFTEFMNELEDGNVTSAILGSSGSGSGTNVYGELANGERVRTVVPESMESRVNATMLEWGVDIRARSDDDTSWTRHMISWAPIVIVVVLLVSISHGLRKASTLKNPVLQQEERLATKAQLLRILTTEARDHSEEELRAALRAEVEAEAEDLRVALYEMLREGTALLTDEKKYRARTTP